MIGNNQVNSADRLQGVLIGERDVTHATMVQKLVFVIDFACNTAVYSKLSPG